jgi:hypothetical protein
MTSEDPGPARMPADVEAPDKVLYGLTFRQLAILAVAAVAGIGAYHLCHRLVPMPVLLIGGALAGCVSFGVAVGRRDGLPMDRWLLHAIRFSRTPRALTTAETTTTPPPWVTIPNGRVALPAPLRLPASAITDDGEIALGDNTTAAIVAATTVNLTLRTTDEQTALVDTFGRWLNSLHTATQIVVSAQPVDLASHAESLAARTRRLPHPALAAAGADHATFLADLAERRDPLRRQVLIAARTPTGAGPHAARRRAEDTVRALSGLGLHATALDGAATTTALAASADPYRPPRPGRLAPPHTTITGPPAGIQKRRTR